MPKGTVSERNRIDHRTQYRIKAAQQAKEIDDALPVLNFGS
ncbi:MAG: hypothetical protein ABEH64_08495 [Salinirussus sp.]